MRDSFSGIVAKTAAVPVQGEAAPLFHTLHGAPGGLSNRNRAKYCAQLPSVNRNNAVFRGEFDRVRPVLPWFPWVLGVLRHNTVHRGTGQQLTPGTDLLLCEGTQHPATRTGKPMNDCDDNNWDYDPRDWREYDEDGEPLEPEERHPSLTAEERNA